MSIKKLSRLRRADPFIEREVEKYQYPLPSREYIAQLLEEQGKPLGLQALVELFDIDEDELDHFGHRLAAMIRDGELMQNRKHAYILPDKVNLIAGYVEGNKEGCGFLIPDDGSDDIFLGPQQMRLVLHKDRVLVRETGIDRRGRREGAIVKVLERHNKEIVGRVFEEHGIRFVTAENRSISQDILVPPGSDAQLQRKIRSGQVVVVEIIEQPSRYAQPIGRIIEVLGDHADPGMEIDIALRKFDLPFRFPVGVQEEAEKIPAAVVDGDSVRARTDLRRLPFVTIDSETAKDFDDAVYAEKKGGNWRLLVAIADVSHYVRPGTALDAEALTRGNSVYFPRRVIPMLPEKLSNGICSLNPDVDRLAMVCEAEIDDRGTVVDYRFYRAIFRSVARLTYTQVGAWLDGSEKPVGKTARGLRPHLNNLYALFKVLRQSRSERGAIDFETVETMMIFNEQGKIEKIVPVERNDAHRLIEECMLVANVCAADFLMQHQQLALFRIHEGPTSERLDNLRRFLAEFGLDLGGGETPTSGDYAELLERIKTRSDANFLQMAMLRSLRQAMYSPDNIGHFGLGYPNYTHFTSPIRRYPDLLVHRAIKAVLDNKKYKLQDYGMAAEAMAAARIAERRDRKDETQTVKRRDNYKLWKGIGIHCSMTERRADDATRDVENWLKCYYMHDRIGEQFDGSISATTSFGIFVTLKDLYVEGLVHIADLGDDYYNYDPIKHRLLGERSGQCYRLGDPVRVQLVRADLETSRIDFVLASMPVAPSSIKTAKRKTASGKKKT